MTYADEIARAFDLALRRVWGAPMPASSPPELRDSELSDGPELQMQTAGVSAKAGVADERGRNDRGTGQL